MPRPKKSQLPLGGVRFGMVRGSPPPAWLPPGWTTGVVDFWTDRWSVRTISGVAGWKDAAGLSWEAQVAIRPDTGVPGVVGIGVATTDELPLVPSDTQLFRSIRTLDLLPLAIASTISFGRDERPQDRPIPLFVDCLLQGKRWSHYVKRSLTPDPSVGERRTSRDGQTKPDDETIARVYLRAVAEGKNPFDVLCSDSGLRCSSPAAARKWVQLAGKNGWLAEGRPSPHFRRGPGPRLREGGTELSSETA